MILLHGQTNWYDLHTRDYTLSLRVMKFPSVWQFQLTYCGMRSSGRTVFTIYITSNEYTTLTSNRRNRQNINETKCSSCSLQVPPVYLCITSWRRTRGMDRLLRSLPLLRIREVQSSYLGHGIGYPTVFMVFLSPPWQILSTSFHTAI